MGLKKTCPLCFKEKKDFTKEHLPFKAIYKNGNNNNPMIIKICNDCNQFKSKLDQEFLARFGNKIGLDEEARKATISLKNNTKVKINKNKKQIIIDGHTNLDELVLFGARYGTDTGNKIFKVGNMNLDILSLWIREVVKGVYYFFEKKINKELMHYGSVNNIEESYKIEIDEKSLNPLAKQLCINEYCSIIYLREKENSPIILMLFFTSRTSKTSYRITKIIYENKLQVENEKENIAKIKENIQSNPFTKISHLLSIKKENLEKKGDYSEDEEGNTFLGNIKRIKKD